MKLGKYTHFKGKTVEVIGVGLNSESLEEVVIYKKLDDSGRLKKGSLWVRPKKMFLERVLIEGKKVPRFKYVRP